MNEFEIVGGLVAGESTQLIITSTIISEGRYKIEIDVLYIYYYIQI